VRPQDLEKRILRTPQESFFSRMSLKKGLKNGPTPGRNPVIEPLRSTSERGRRFTAATWTTGCRRKRELQEKYNKSNDGGAEERNDAHYQHNLPCDRKRLFSLTSPEKVSML